MRLVPTLNAIFLGLLVSTGSQLAMSQSNPPAPEAVYGKGVKSFTLATGSPGELGLLQALGEAFDKKEGARLVWIKAGSGASLKLLKNAQVDMIMVHAPEAVNQATTEGWAVNRTLIGSNEFYIVGPKNDPANLKSASSGADAYTKIANSQSKFISREIILELTKRKWIFGKRPILILAATGISSPMIL